MSEDRSARFARLLLPHLGAAYRLARWLVRAHEDAEDVVQDAYLQAHRAFDSLRGEAEARPWLLAIVRHSAYGWLRARQRLPLHELFDDDLHESAVHATAAAEAPADANPESLLLRREDAARLHAAVDALPLVFREVLVLREFEDLSYREIASLLGVPAGTVMSRLSRARQHLLRSLTGAAAPPGQMPEMDCAHCRPLLSPLLDDELPADQAAPLRAHLQRCDDCAAQLASLQSLRAGLRAHAPALPDLAPLAARIQASLPQAPQARQQRRPPRLVWLWPALGSGLVSALAAAALTLQLARPSVEDGLQDVASATFLRATRLAPSHRQGLASADPAQLQAWLQQQLGRAVPVPAAPPPGFELAGARVDYLYRQPVAALVFQRGTHRVEVYLWPQGQEAALHDAADEDGLRIRFWSRGAVHRCAISDLDAATLDAFVAGFAA